MLAPRKKLWSTPSSAVDVALSFANLDSDDVVYDVGCGDGRVLIQMASLSVLPASAMVAPPDADDGAASSTEPDGNNGDQNTHDKEQPQCHHHTCRQFVGIEISPERADEARNNILRARQTNRIPPHVSLDVICANALDTTAVDYKRATVIFLYLVPRGLRLIKGIVWPGGGESNEMIVSTSDKRPRRIITYMSPFENTSHVRKGYCRVDHQDGAAWPVYLYQTDM